MEKKLTRSNNKIIAGVCGGIGEYLNIDPTIVRIVWALFSLFYGSGLVLYLVAALIMPVKEDIVEIKTQDEESSQNSINNETDGIDIEIVE